MKYKFPQIREQIQEVGEHFWPIAKQSLPDISEEAALAKTAEMTTAWLIQENRAGRALLEARLKAGKLL